MKPANTVLSRYGATIFETMSMLARQHNAINLGQGFPDEDGPIGIREAAARVQELSGYGLAPWKPL